MVSIRMLEKYSFASVHSLSSQNGDIQEILIHYWLLARSGVAKLPPFFAVFCRSPRPPPFRSCHASVMGQTLGFYIYVCSDYSLLIMLRLLETLLHLLTASKISNVLGSIPSHACNLLTPTCEQKSTRHTQSD